MFASFYIRHTCTGHMHTFSSQKWFQMFWFKCHFWFTSTECSVLVASVCLTWICDHQWHLCRGCEASAAVVLWNYSLSVIVLHHSSVNMRSGRLAGLFGEDLAFSRHMQAFFQQRTTVLSSWTWLHWSVEWLLIH